MCTSVLQIVFTVVLVCGTAATLISMFTPGWRNMKSTTNTTNIFNSVKSIASSGIFQFVCSDTNTGLTSTGSVSTSTNVCDSWWQSKADWEKAVIIAMCLALVAEVAAFAWSFVTCFMCCCKSCLTPPLAILTGIATICLLVAVIVFGIKNKSQINSIPTSTGQLNSDSNVGYSFWIAILALVIMAVDTIIAILLSKTAKVSPI